MALSLTEAAKLTQDQLHRGVIETITEDSVLMQNLPFIDIMGNAYSYVRENALPSASFRAVNAGYTESGGTYDKKSVSLSILGGDVDVDKFVTETLSGGIADHRASQTAMKAKSVRLAFHNAFVNGTGSNNEFEGINALITGTDQELDSEADGMEIIGASSNDRQAFFDKIDELVASVNGTPSMLLMNSHVLAQFKSAARRESAYDETRDAFGKAVVSYQGIPLVDIGNDEDGNPIIAHDETYGTSTAASSIYAVRFDANDGVVGLTRGGVKVTDLGEIDAKPAFRTRIEFYCAVAQLSAKSAAVLRGLILKPAA